MEGLVKQNRSLAQKILDFIKDLIGRITGKGFKITENYTIREAEMLSEADAKDLQEIRRLFEKALAKTKERVTTATETDTEAQKNTDSKAEGEGDKRYSIKRDTDGSYFVDVEGNIILNVAEKDIVKTLANVVNTKFKTFVDANGQKIGINMKTAREWANSKYAQNLKHNDVSTYEDKLRAFNNSDELLKASTDYVAEMAKHKNFKEFARGKVNFRVDNNGYQADIIVGITANKTAVLYDIVSIKNKKITELLNTTSETKSFQNRSNNSVTNSIPDNSENVNTQNTFHSLPQSDSMGNTLSEQQREYFKDSKVVDEKGRLLVVYHGTFTDYSVFDINKTSNTNYWGKGWYFTNSEIDAKNNYASNKGADVHTKIKEPAVVKGAVEQKMNKHNPLLTDSVISLAQLFDNVNTKKWKISEICS